MCALKGGVVGLCNFAAPVICNYVHESPILYAWSESPTYMYIYT